MASASISLIILDNGSSRRLPYSIGYCPHYAEGTSLMSDTILDF